MLEVISLRPAYIGGTLDPSYVRLKLIAFRLIVIPSEFMKFSLIARKSMKSIQCEHF